MSLGLDSLREGWDFEAKLAIGQDGKGQLPNNLWETYSAMANTHGGIVVLGVKEKSDGRLVVHGLAAVDKIERDLWNCLANTEKVSCNLLGREAVERHDIEGKTVLVLRIPRADRRQRPVFINNNPMRGTFVRTHEGDRRASEDTVRRMLSDADERPRDGEIQEHFSIDDLDPDSLAAYRHLFRSNYSGHPFLAGDDRDMLRQLGGWSLDRAAGTEGLTLAGLLMFGCQRSILDRLPYYQLDYRHLPSTTIPELPRWLDRVTLDGTWSGNLFDFFRKVIPKLRDGLRVPFLMGPDLFRRDESPQHEALREAIVNALIHADYMARGGIRIFRLPHGFEFYNPGLLRLPAQQIRAGGKSDCRNPSLQQMFQMIGAGEKAGSGFPKILQAWREQHWRAPALEENAESEEICLRLPTISLFPPEVTEEMERRFPKRLHRLDENGRLAVATAILEKRVTNERLQELTDKHPRDITFLLKRLVEKGFLVVNEKRRWSSYSIAPDSTAGGLNNSQHKEPSSQHKDASSQHKDLSSQHKDLSSQHKETGFRQSEAGPGQAGVSTLDADSYPPLIQEIRGQQRSRARKMEEAILVLCADRSVMAQELAEILQRSMETLKNHYISRLVHQGKLELRFPGQPTHPAQAYRTTATGIPKGHNNDDSGTGH